MRTASLSVAAYTALAAPGLLFGLVAALLWQTHRSPPAEVWLLDSHPPLGHCNATLFSSPSGVEVTSVRAYSFHALTIGKELPSNYRSDKLVISPAPELLWNWLTIDLGLTEDWWGADWETSSRTVGPFKWVRGRVWAR